MTSAKQPTALSAPEENTWAGFARMALVLSIALVVARATILETVRETFAAVPGVEAGPRGPGAGAALAMNFLAYVPALFVLVRRVFDPRFLLRWSWSHLPLLGLAVWAMASTIWSADKFATLVRAADFLGAAVLLWAAAQLVADWADLRLVAAAMLGLLLVMSAHGLMYRYLDVPAMRQEWTEHKSEYLKRANLEEGTFAARQFEVKWNSGEMMGFSASPNTFAAVLVLLGVVALGLAVQRLSDGDGIGWAVAWGIIIALVLGSAVWVLRYTFSRTALATLPLACVALLLTIPLREWLAKHSRSLYIAAMVVAAIALGGLLAVGLQHGGLIDHSLTFRWHYWTGAARMLMAHPVLGVGFGDFGQHYLLFRLPVAPEEIKDPHNFIVRVFAELGMVGGVLLLMWMLRAGWELTQRVCQPDGAERRGQHGGVIGLPLTIAAAGTALAVAVSADWNIIPVYDLFKRGIFALLLVIGMVLGCMRPQEQPVRDDRPAPYLLTAILIALGVFLLHNLIDFSLFETGPMFCFALLAGSAMGICRKSATDRGGDKGPVVLLIVALIAWIAGIGVILAPTVAAEDLAQQGDENIRRGHFTEAADKLQKAFAQQPLDGELAYRVARAMEFEGRNASETRRWYDRAIAANPVFIRAYRDRAMLEMRQPAPDARRVMADFGRALTLDPQGVTLRLQYAQSLQKLSLPAEARRQYQEALARDNLLPTNEIKRLSPQRVREIQTIIQSLE